MHRRTRILGNRAPDSTVKFVEKLTKELKAVRHSRSTTYRRFCPSIGNRLPTEVPEAVRLPTLNYVVTAKTVRNGIYT